MDFTKKLLWTTAISDLVSTETAQHNNCVEVNPLMKNRAVRISAKLAETYFIERVTDWAAKKKGKRKAALVIRWTIIGAFAFATGNNVMLSW